MAWVHERTILTERPPLVGEVSKLVPTFADRGCHMVSVTDPYGSILGFLGRSRYVFFQIAPQLYSRGWVNPVPHSLILRRSGSTSESVAKALWARDHRGSHGFALWALDHRGSHALCCVFKSLIRPCLNTGHTWLFMVDFNMEDPKTKMTDICFENTFPCARLSKHHSMEMSGWVDV
jgi:hypothetical protein